jgi:hypothetical protein
MDGRARRHAQRERCKSARGDRLVAGLAQYPSSILDVIENVSAEYEVETLSVEWQLLCAYRRN